MSREFCKKDAKSILIKGPKKFMEADISIVIPTFKRPELLKIALDSALSQATKYKYYVVVVNNEGESCITDKLINEYQDDRLIYYKNEVNIGIIGNWNRCIELSPTKYACMLHDDDFISNDYIDIICNAIKSYPDGKAFWGKYYNIKNNNVDFFGKCKLGVGITPLRIEDFLYNYVPASTGMCVNKDIFKKEGGFIYDNVNSDGYFMANMIRKYNTYVVSSYITYKRWDCNISKKTDVYTEFPVFWYELLESLKYGLNVEEYDHVYHTFMSDLLRGMKKDFNIRLDLYEDLVKKYLMRQVSHEDEMGYEMVANRYKKDFNDRTYIMKEIDPDVKTKEIVIYGAGENGKVFYDSYKSILNIIHIIDQDINKQGLQIGDLKIEGLSCIDELKKDQDIIYVITVYKFASKIKQNLIARGIKDEQICFSFMN